MEKVPTAGYAMENLPIKEYNFGWPEIILSTLAKTLINLNFKFLFTYTPFFIQDFGLSLKEWGAILTVPELMMVICSAVTVFLAPFPPNKVNSFFMVVLVLPNVLQPLGIALFPKISVFYWILANRLVFGIAFAVINSTVTAVIGDFTSERIRGKAMGSVEFSWALADYLMPLLGVLLKVAPIYVVYYVQAGAGLIIAVMLYVMYPNKAKSYTKLHNSTVVELSPLIVGKTKGETREKSILSILNNRKVIGICFWSVFSMAYMLIFAYVGVWLQGEFGLNSAQVGLAYFFCFTLAETISFVYMSILGDKVGLLRSAYIMTVVCTISGLVFGIFSSTLKLIPALFLVGVFMCASEVMYISVFAYTTTKEVCNNASLISTVLWTAVNSGKAIFVGIGPAVWTATGAFLDGHKSGISQFGGIMLLSTVIIFVSVCMLEIGQQSTCRK